MKFIKNLTINYLFFLNNFNELKKMEINSLEVSSITTSTFNPQYVHLNSEIIIQNFDKIEKFLIENDPKEITSFLDVIRTPSTYSLMYVIISKKRFPQREKAIFSNPSDKKEYSELIEDGCAK